MVSLPRLLVGAVAVGWLAVPSGPVPPAAAGMVETNAPHCNGVVVRRTAWLMGTTLDATVCATRREQGIAAIELAFDEVRTAERRLSSWDATSELSRLNQAPPGRWIEMSPWTAAILAEVRDWVVATGGAFDPAVGSAVAAWDLHGAGRTASSDELRDAHRQAGMDAWQIDPVEHRARHAPGVRLDAGGFGKGAGLRKAALSLDGADLAWAILDFGGQLLIRSRDVSLRWPVAVADPRDRERPAFRLTLGPGSVATSAASERYVETAQGRVGHLIDPRTARPVPAWGSVTVVADDPLVADVLSTALFVAGPGRALALAGEHGAEALIVEPTPAGLSAASTPGLADVVRPRPASIFNSQTPRKTDR